MPWSVAPAAFRWLYCATSLSHRQYPMCDIRRISPVDLVDTDVAHSRPMDYSTLPARLKRIANLKQFADDSGIHRRTLQRVMTGASSPNLATCQAIERALLTLKPAKKKAEA